MEKSHQDARVGTAPAGNGMFGLSRLPSPSRGGCQTSGLAAGARHGGGSLVHDDSALLGHAPSKMAPAGIFQNASSLL